MGVLGMADGRGRVRGVGLVVMVVVAALSVVAVGCGTDDADGSDAPAATPTAERVVVDAHIDEAELITRESFPPQYAVRVVVGVPNGCTAFESVEVERSGTAIVITATNTTIDDPNVACTQIYGMHEETVELGSDFDEGVTYTVTAGEFVFEIVGVGTGE